MIHATVRWGATEMEIAAVYAPAQPIPRIDFFNAELRHHTTNLTIAGGDWNCVPDKTLDVTSANPLGSANHGASLLEDIMATKMLTDERREQLDQEKELTWESEDATVAKRLDRWYVPDSNELSVDLRGKKRFRFQEDRERPQCGSRNYLRSTTRTGNWDTNAAL